MPELAEVEYYRLQWDAGRGAEVVDVHLDATKRIFRGEDTNLLVAELRGARFQTSEAHGKQMLLRFSRHIWLGIHLGMTGELRVAGPDFNPEKHNHLVLFQKKRSLVFSDPRLFGRIRFHQGSEPPSWWANLSPALTSKEFTPEILRTFLSSHSRLPLKAVLLLQDGFPGVGNWMADEILWRARLNPKRRVAELKPSEQQRLWEQIIFVVQGAIEHISPSFGDPPPGWLFNERWSAKGKCPLHQKTLERATIGGRTTAWCARCQP